MLFIDFIFFKFLWSVKVEVGYIVRFFGFIFSVCFIFYVIGFFMKDIFLILVIVFFRFENFYFIYGMSMFIIV